MKKKVLIFVMCNRKLLALRNNPQNPKHGGDFWFVVIGEVKKGENRIDAVKREIKEETGLNSKEILFLNWGSIYEWERDLCKELNFVSFVDSGNVTLNEEHTEYEWLDIGDFIERIKWYGDKKILGKVLEKALNKKQYFRKRKIKDYRNIFI